MAVIATGWLLGLVSVGLWATSYALDLRAMPTGQTPPVTAVLQAVAWSWFGRFGIGSLWLPWLIQRGLERPWNRDRWGRQLIGHLGRAAGVFLVVVGLYWLMRQFAHLLGAEAYSWRRLLRPLLEGVLLQDLTLYTGVSLGASWVARVLLDGRLQQELAETRLSLLKTQLDPHFLFNALNSLAELAATDGPRAERSILKMGEFLRTLLEADPRRLIPLATELEQLRAYLEIQKARFQDQLEFSTELGEGCLEALVPTMILQPLAENSIKHGRQPRSVLRLTLKGRRQEAHLELDFEDDGKGPAESFQRGVGLDNCAARLRALFEDRASLAIEPRPEGGARVRIILPWCLEAPTRTSREMP